METYYNPADLLSKGCARPETRHVPVYPGNGGGGEKITQRRVHRLVLLHEVRPAPEHILLVVRLGEVEPGGRKDLRIYPSVSPDGLAAPRPDRHLFLFVAAGKDRGHVLTLPGTLPRIMACPEDIEQFPVGDHGRIEVHLDRLDVVPEILIRGILRRSPRVPDAGAKDAGETPEPGVRTPESAQGEGRRLNHSGQGCIHRGNRRGSMRRPALRLPCHRRPLRSRWEKSRAVPWKRGQEVRRDKPDSDPSEKERPFTAPERERSPFHRGPLSVFMVDRVAASCPSVAARRDSLQVLP